MATFQTSIDTAEKMANGSYDRWQNQNAQADTAQSGYKGWIDNDMPNRQALQDEADTKYDVSGAQNAYKTARDNVARVQTAMATLPEIERSMSKGLSAAQAGTLLGQNTNRYATTLAQMLPSAQLTSDDYNMATSLARAMAEANYSAGMDRGSVLNDFWKTLRADANSAYGANQTDRGILDSAIAARAADDNDKARIALARQEADAASADIASYFGDLLGETAVTYDSLPIDVDGRRLSVDLTNMTPEELAEYERQRNAYYDAWTAGFDGDGNELTDILRRMQVAGIGQ